MTATDSGVPDPADNPPPIDSAVFRDVLGHYPTGVVVVTGRSPEEELLAMVLGTFNSVSLDPPLVAFFPAAASTTFQDLRLCESLCINVLAGEQEAACRTIAGRRQHKLDGVDWFPSPSGDPILADSLAWLDVRLTQVLEAGDHLIALCRVVGLSVNNPVNPLLFFQGGYGSFVVPSLVARPDAEIIGAVRQAVAVRPELETLATSLGTECHLIAQANRDELVAVASASATGVSVSEGLGERMPFVPPLGDSLVFNAADEDRAYWLGRGSHASAEQQQVYRDRLEQLATHGYVLSFLPSETSDAFQDVVLATQEYAKGQLTPKQEKEIRQRIQSSGVDFSLREITAEEIYHVGSIVVPVDARPPMMLRVGQLPTAARGSEVIGWIDRTKAAADAISARLRAEQRPAI